MSIELYRAEYLKPRIIDDDISRKCEELKSRMSDKLGRDQMVSLSYEINEVFFGGCDCCGNDMYIDMFVDAKRLEGRTESTLKTYVNEIKLFMEYCGVDIKSVTSNDVRRYLSYKKTERKNSDRTLNNSRRYLCSFFSWLEEEDIIPKSPMRKVKPIKEPKTKKLPFSDIEMDRIRNACENVRDRTIIEFLDSSGMRVSELAGLNISDIDISNHECTVFGKGRKTRKCFLSDVACSYASEYIGMLDPECKAFIVNISRRGFGTERLTKSSIESVVRKIGEKAGVPNCHPHRFRRTMASRNLKRGMRIEDIQKLLGHEKVETTLIYAVADEDSVKNEARRLMG